MQASNPIRILVVDDHDFMRNAIRQLINLQSDMQVVGEASNGEEAVRLFEKLHPDLALVDLRMKGMDGIETLVAIRKQYPRSRIVILSAYQFPEDVERSLVAGASAYVVKDSMQDEVLQVIRSVCSEYM